VREIFIFLAAEKLTFLGAVKLQNWLASDHPGAYTSMSHPFLAQKMFVILRKRWPNKKLFLGRPAAACTQTQLFLTPQKIIFTPFPYQGSDLSSLGRLILKKQGLTVSACFFQKVANFPQGLLNDF